MDILQFISSSGFITVNKHLIKELGLHEAIMLGELASESSYWHNRGESDEGWFFSTIENIEEKTTLSRYQQKKALDKLESENIISVQVKGIPARRFIRINTDILTNKFAKNSQSGTQKTDKLECKKLARNKNISNNNISNKNIEIYSGLPADLVTALKDYEDMRKKNKSAMTDRARVLLVNKLTSMAQGEDEIINTQQAIKILEQSIMNGWKSVYPLKEDKKKTVNYEDIDW